MKIEAFQCNNCHKQYLDGRDLIFQANPGYEVKDEIVHFCNKECMESYKKYLIAHGYLMHQDCPGRFLGVHGLV